MRSHPYRLPMGWSSLSFFLVAWLIALSDVVAVPPIKTLPGFKVELIHQVDKESEGSWVSMCFDDQGLLYVCDQYGKLYRLTLKNGRVVQKKALQSPGRAQGLCWAHGSLYMVVSGGKESGVHRLTSTKGDGEFDEIEHILPISGAGEHGPHGIVQTADGKGLYVVLGNHSRLPKGTTSVVSHNWGEDTLLQHLPDASGHAVKVKAPGGTLLRLSPDGKMCEVISMGMRNTYDIAVSPEGEVFGFDSDMEWDIGTPWYRPTRVLHLTRGSEFGWRTGTAKWPAYYADSLGSVVDIGPGSPTGVLFGTEAAFPLKYRKALYVLDWTFGRIYAVHLQPNGAGYSADYETFLSGKPLPLCDAAVGPDGAMYFTTGGRRLQSGLFRVSYEGVSDTSEIVAKDSAAKMAREALLGSKNIDEIWDHLDDDDRVMRYSARVALENLHVDKWLPRLKSEASARKSITAAIALARLSGDAEALHAKLLSISYDPLSAADKLDYLRAVALTYIRCGEGDEAVRSGYLAKLENMYPSMSYLENVELCRVLVYLRAPSAVQKTVQLMECSVNTQKKVDLEVLEGNDRYAKDIKKMLANQPDTGALQFALILMNAKEGWNAHTVRVYFIWLAMAESKSGGKSYKGFIRNIREVALSNLTPERAKLAMGLPKLKPIPGEIAVAKGPGRIWTLETATAAVKDLSMADYQNGKRMFTAALCVRCHQHGNEGGNSGPDLTNLANRFTKTDTLKAILEPSEVISEQYAFTTLHLEGGEQVVGKVMKDDGKTVWLAPSAFDFSKQVQIPAEKILKRSASKVSSMPPALIYSLNPDELRDLIKFLSSQPPG